MAARITILSLGQRVPEGRNIGNRGRQPTEKDVLISGEPQRGGTPAWAQAGVPPRWGSMKFSMRFPHADAWGYRYIVPPGLFAHEIICRFS